MPYTLSVFHLESRMRKTGFTKLELIVVIAVIGVVASFLLPAVQNAREQSRRFSCSNNLTQIILGIQHYESAFGCFPPGTIDSVGPIQNTNVGYHHGWITQILPFMDEGNLFEAIDRTQSIYAPANLPVGNQKISVLACPTSSSPFLFSHYAGCHHNVESPIDDTNHGVFFLNSHVRIKDIHDGLSHTLFIGEKEPDEWDQNWASGTRATLRNTGPMRDEEGLKASRYNSPVRPYLYQDTVSTSPTASPPGMPQVGRLGMPRSSNSGRPRPAANGPKSGFGSPLFVGGFSSQHSGGIVQYAAGDGHIGSFTRRTDSKIMSQLGHRADGELPLSCE